MQISLSNHHWPVFFLPEGSKLPMETLYISTDVALNATGMYSNNKVCFTFYINNNKEKQYLQWEFVNTDEHFCKGFKNKYLTRIFQHFPLQ